MPDKYKYFSESELACRCGACGLGQDDMNPIFMRRITLLRLEFDRPMIVTSAFRCPAYNEMWSSTSSRTGPHTQGVALDIRVYGEWVHDLLTLALEMDFPGVGLYQKGAVEGRYIHIDWMPSSDAHPRPWIWTY